MTKPESEFAAIQANCLALLGYCQALAGQIRAFFPVPKPQTGHPANAPGAIAGLLESCRAGARNILDLCNQVEEGLEGFEPLAVDDPPPKKSGAKKSAARR